MMENPYLRFGLRFNPFPRSEAEQYRNEPERLRVFLFEDEKRKLEKFAKEIESTSVSFVVVGPWGTGKSLFLLYFYRLLREYFGKDKVVLCYVKAPSDTLSLLRGIAEELSKIDSRLKIGKRVSEDDLLRGIRESVRRLVQEDKVVFIAIDQLEETYRKLKEELEGDEFRREVSRLAETIRGKLSAMESRKYALGISVIEVEWTELIDRWPSLGGLDVIRLRVLHIDEISPFIENFLNSARDKEYIEQNPELAKSISENPCYPFAESVLNEIYNLSAGIQRYVCSYASKVLDYVATKNYIEVIDTDILYLAIDPIRHIWRTINKEILPFHPWRVKSVLSEILAWIDKDYGESLGMLYLGSPKRDIHLVQIGDKVLALASICRSTTIKGDLIEDTLKKCGREIEVSGVKIKIDRIVLLFFVPSNVSLGKLLDFKARVILAGKRDFIKWIKINRDSDEEWGRLAALYAAIRGILPTYLTMLEDKAKEAQEVLKILGILE